MVRIVLIYVIYFSCLDFYLFKIIKNLYYFGDQGMDCIVYYFLIGFNVLKLCVDGNFSSDVEYEGVDIFIRIVIFVYVSVSFLFCVFSLQRLFKDESV